MPEEIKRKLDEVIRNLRNDRSIPASVIKNAVRIIVRDIYNNPRRISSDEIEHYLSSHPELWD